MVVTNITNKRTWPTLVIHIKKEDKNALLKEAEKRGLQLIPYCRMILLNNLNKQNA